MAFNNKTITNQANLFKIISDPTRLKIISLLFNNKKEICVSDISSHIKISHSATSHQFAKLESLGLVECLRQGHMMCYKTTNHKLNNIIKKIIKTTSL